jgi:Ca-activated chloride channel family protein
MKLLEPAALLAFVAVIAVAIVYLVRLPFRRRYVIALPTTSALAAVAPRRPGWQRHVSTLLFLAAIAVTVFAFARPHQERAVARDFASLIVALDTSNSMRATDVDPRRLDAARRGALQLVADVPRSVQVGLVTFSGTATIAVPPTSDRGAFRDGIAAVDFGEGTSLGEGIEASVTAIEQQLAELELTTSGRGRSSGSAPPAAVVMFSDGQQTIGADEAAAIEVARQADVAVSTVAVGTRDGAVAFDDVRVAAPVNRRSLAVLADATKGRVFVARPGTEFDSVYDAMARRLGTTDDSRDFTGWLLAVAVGLGAAALAAAFAWGPRVP